MVDRGGDQSEVQIQGQSEAEEHNVAGERAEREENGGDGCIVCVCGGGGVVRTDLPPLLTKILKETLQPVAYTGKCYWKIQSQKLLNCVLPVSV